MEHKVTRRTKGFKSTKWIKGKKRERKKKPHRGHGCLSVVSVVCCQVEVSATSWSLVQRSPTDCGVSEMCVTMKPRRIEEAQAHIRLSSHIYKKKNSYDAINNICVIYVICTLLTQPGFCMFVHMAKFSVL
jgi:hypothetical protein